MLYLTVYDNNIFPLYHSTSEEFSPRNLPHKSMSLWLSQRVTSKEFKLYKESKMSLQPQWNEQVRQFGALYLLSFNKKIRNILSLLHKICGLTVYVFVLWSLKLKYLKFSLVLNIFCSYWSQNYLTSVKYSTWLIVVPYPCLVGIFQ